MARSEPACATSAACGSCSSLAITAVVGTFTFNFSVVLPLFVEHTLHGNDATYTLVYSVLSIGSVGAALVAAHTTRVQVRHVVMLAAAFGVAMLLFAVAPNLAASFPVALLVGFASVAFLTAISAIVQLRADPSMRGRVLALQAVVLIGSTPIGGPILGAVCDTFGARWGLAIGGVAALGASGWGFLAARRPPSRPPAIVRGPHGDDERPRASDHAHTGPSKPARTAVRRVR